MALVENKHEPLGFWCCFFFKKNRNCVEAWRIKSKLTVSSSSVCSPSIGKVVQQGLKVFNFLWYGSSKDLYPER